MTAKELLNKIIQFENEGNDLTKLTATFEGLEIENIEIENDELLIT